MFEGLHADVRDRVNQEGGWYWRVDAVSPYGIRQGEIMLFNVFEFSTSTNFVSKTFFSGESESGLSFDVQSTFRTYDWSVSTAFDWIRLRTTEGTGSGGIEFDLDSTGLENGVHVGRILVVPDGGTPLSIEVRMSVVGFNPVKLISHPHSKMVYGISRTGSEGFTPVILFALDAESENITTKVSLDSGFDDFVIQADDELLFVRNTRTGLVLGLDLESFEVVKQFSFTSSGGRNELAGLYHGSKGYLILQLTSPAPRTVLFSIANEKVAEEIVNQIVDGVVSDDGSALYMIRESSREYYLQRFNWISGSYNLVKEAKVVRFQSSGKNHITASADGQFVYWAGGVYSAGLDLVHETSEEIYSTTDTGRFAISTNSIFDIPAREMMYRLPFPSQVSVFNSLTRKLMVLGNERISGYLIEDPAQTLRSPELVQVDMFATAAVLVWHDRSLENEFTVLYRSLDEESEWVEYGRLGPNADRLEVRGLKSGVSYAFKVQALDGLQNLSESNEVVAKTLYMVPGAPRWVQPDTSWDRVILGWTGDYQKDDEIVLERKRRDKQDWASLALLPPDVREYIDRDIFSGYYYDYRIAAKNPAGISSWSQVMFAYVPYFLYFENGGFENDTLSGWEVQDIPHSQLPVSFRHAGYSPLRGFFQTEPTEGHHVLVHGLAGAEAGSIRFSQEILIPNQGAMLAFDYRAAWTAFPPNTVRVWDVSIENPVTDEVLEIYPLIIATSNNSNLDTGNKTDRVDLSKYAGKTVRVSFGTEVDGVNEGFGIIQLDHVRLEVEVSYALSVIHDPENGFTISVKNPPLGRLVLEQSTDFKNWVPFLTRNVYENTGAIIFHYQVDSELEQTYQFYRVRNE